MEVCVVPASVCFRLHLYLVVFAINQVPPPSKRTSWGAGPGPATTNHRHQGWEDITASTQARMIFSSRRSLEFVIFGQPFLENVLLSLYGKHSLPSRMKFRLFLVSPERARLARASWGISDKVKHNFLFLPFFSYTHSFEYSPAKEDQDHDQPSEIITATELYTAKMIKIVYT